VKGSLLVPLDGSESTEHALPFAIGIAEACHLPVELLQVVTSGADGHGEMHPDHDPGIRPEVGSERVDQAHAYLDGIARLVRARVPAAVSTAVRFESPVAGIRQAAKEAGCSLIVMTRHARRGRAQRWLGSVTDGVVRASKLPVLIVPPGLFKPYLDILPGMRKILLPIDGPELSPELLPIARDLGAVAGIHFTLLWLTRDGIDGARSATMPERDVDDSHLVAYLLEQASLFAPGSVEVVVRRTAREAIATTIAREADEMGADLIGMATRAHSPVDPEARAIPDEVLRSVSRPVLLYRPPRPDAERRSFQSAARRVRSRPTVEG
jgi:nucleotide-binding universal stress UspA family protein